MFSLTAHRVHLIAQRWAPLLPLLALLVGGLFGAAGAAEAANPYALPLQWQDDQGGAVRLEQFRGQPVLLTMAYATCRETCSYALRRLDQLQQEAARAGQALQIIVVSYDPWALTTALDGAHAGHRQQHFGERANERQRALRRRDRL